MDRLLDGIRTFRMQEYPARAARYEALAAGQHPPTLLITCSDSRIVPHLLTQTEPGELFVLRNAGNLVPPYDAAAGGEAATIEYAVKALRVKEIVVCGHSHCGAISAVLRPELARELPAVGKWLAHAERVRQLLAEQGQQPAAGDVLTAAVQANVLVQLDHLRTHPAVSEAEASGTVALYGCFYRFETGEVETYDGSTGQFVPILDSVRSETSTA